MDVTMTWGNFINVIIIAVGIGVCGLSVMQVSSGIHIRTEVKKYFQLFFSLIIIYISMHLTRQMLDGQSGQGIHIAIMTVTFIEFLVSGFMVYMISMLILFVADPPEHKMAVARYYMVVLIVHVVLLIISQFTDLFYYFDSVNTYHRGSGYILSNLSAILLLISNMVLLVRYRDKISRRIAIAFWIYMLAPLVAIGIQAVASTIQFIIMATVGAAVYMYSAIVREQTERYEAQQKEAGRLETELSMATRIQADTLPNIFPAFPERDDFNIYASMNPAKEVGGDFYDFFLIDEDHLGIVIADVSGKGVPAALFMMISKILVQNYASMGLEPKQVLESVNRQICLNNREEMFVTVWFGSLNLKTGRLLAANAGHEYPVLKKPGEHFELIKDKHGFVIGGMEGMKYSQYELQMDPGAKLFLYTDGVAEATNAREELFGTDRMVEALRLAENDSPKEVLDMVHAAVDSFVKDAPQFDDLTMLCVEFVGREQAAGTEKKEKAAGTEKTEQA